MSSRPPCGDTRRRALAGLAAADQLNQRGSFNYEPVLVPVSATDEVGISTSTNELAAFHAVKMAFDEHALLNPGKAVPTLARCAEYGGMRVHGGKLPHPDLPRF